MNSLNFSSQSLLKPVSHFHTRHLIWHPFEHVLRLNMVPSEP